jgi:ribulose-5-phosphate 4-epimerase/fuculose-1-phosphate aldolase
MNKEVTMVSIPTNRFDTPEIRAAREDLAAAFRWSANLGMHEGTCNHFSVLVPGLSDHYLINPFGLHFSEIRASDLLILDGSGSIVDGQGTVEASAFHIHSSVHRANANAVCVLHTHMPYACAILGTKDGRLELCHQNAARFYGRIAYDYETGGFQGLALDNQEGSRMARDLGDKTILMMECHGPLVTGASVAQAFDNLYYLERAAQVQVLAMSMNRPLALISDEMARLVGGEFVSQAEEYADAHFGSIKRMLDREDMTWRD